MTVTDADSTAQYPNWNRPGVRVHAAESLAGLTICEGDALDFIECLPDRFVPVWIADPPYASGGATTTSRRAPPGAKYGLVVGQSFEGDNRDARSFALWATEWMRAAWRKTRPDGGLIFVHTDWRQIPAVSDALQSAGWIWRGLITWDKNGAGRGLRWGFRSTAEFVVWGSRGLPPESETWPTAKAGVFRVSGVRGRSHMTEKPAALLAEFIQQVPPGRGPVVDPFMGSGSTLAAAAALHRPALGCDINPAFCRLAAERLGMAL